VFCWLNAFVHRQSKADITIKYLFIQQLKKRKVVVLLSYLC
jgi:hypothetical protein